MLLLVACADPVAVKDSADPADTATTPWTLDATELDHLTIETNGLSVPTTLLRVTRPDGAPTFLQWVPPLTDFTTTVDSVVVTTQPYDGITWTGEDLDADFPTHGPRDSDGLWPDLACPGAPDRGIAYAELSPEAAVQGVLPQLLNGHGVLLAYGRFYACDDIVGEAQDMQAAMAWVQETFPDAAVGTWGGSWGGFLALYAGAESQADVVVPLFPPSDMQAMLDHVEAMQADYPYPEQLVFFDPYVDRVQRGLATDAARFTTDALCAGLGDTPTLLLHDEWDTLVPFSASVSLAEACGLDTLWWPRQGPVDYDQVGLDHGLVGKEAGYPSVYTFSYGYLFAHLNAPDVPILTLGDRVSLEGFFAEWKAEQAAGGDTEMLRQRLVELAVPGAQIYLAATGEFAPLDTVLADAVNTTWGTSFDADGLRAQLTTGLPR